MADNESETSEYTVTVGGVEHTVLLSEEDAEAKGLTGKDKKDESDKDDKESEKDAESKSAKPANKSATPANKGTSDK